MTTNDCPPAIGQMELTFNAPTPAMPAPTPSTVRPRPGTPPRTRRQAAARWWFARMRDVVRDARLWTAEAQAAVAAAQADLPLAFPATRLQRPRLAVVPATVAFPGPVTPFPTRPAEAA